MIILIKTSVLSSYENIGAALPPSIVNSMKELLRTIEEGRGSLLSKQIKMVTDGEYHIR